MEDNGNHISEEAEREKERVKRIALKKLQQELIMMQFERKMYDRKKKCPHCTKEMYVVGDKNEYWACHQCGFKDFRKSRYLK